jgi:hypothetical protein
LFLYSDVLVQISIPHKNASIPHKNKNFQNLKNMPSKVGYLQRYLIIIDQVRRNRYISMDKLVDVVRGKNASYVDPGMELLPPLIDAIKNAWVTEFYYSNFD